MDISRRQMLQLSAAAIASGAWTGCASTKQAGKGPFTGSIDAHSHVWSDDLKRYPLAPWATPADMKPATFTDDELLVVAKHNGVDRVVLIQHAPLHGYGNSYILDCAKNHPGVFSVVAMVNERTPNLQQRLSTLRDAGARGIRIIPTKHADRTLNVDPPNWLKAPGMKLLWKHAAELNVAICPLLEADALPTLDPMCQQNPDTTCVIDHFGHIDINKPETVTALTRLARYPNVHVKVSAFYKFGDGKAPYADLTPMLERVIDAFGPDRLMWASDLPYQLNNGNNYEDAIGLMRDGLSDLSAAERQAILRDTAARVFF